MPSPESGRGPNRLQSALIALTRATPLKGGVTRKFMGDLVRAAGPRIIEGDFRGARFLVHLGDNLTERNLLLDPRTEKTELDFLIASTPKDGVFVDLGSNIGMYALVVAAARPAVRIVAIEADPAIRERLHANIVLSGLTNIIVRGEAAGETEGEVAFSRDSHNLGESHVDPNGSFKVRVRPLTDILADAGVMAVDSLKIDIEGYEDRALLPWLRTAPRPSWPRALVIEHVHPEQWREDCMAALAGMGYRAVGKAEYNTLLRLA